MGEWRIEKVPLREAKWLGLGKQSYKAVVSQLSHVSHAFCVGGTLNVIKALEERKESAVQGSTLDHNSSLHPSARNGDTIMARGEQEGRRKANSTQTLDQVSTAARRTQTNSAREIE